MFSNKRLTWIFTTVFVFALALAAGGCSSSASNAKATDVNVNMANYAFTLDKDSVPAGQVTFHVTNPASEPDHEMVVIKTDLDAKQLPTADDKSADESKLESKGEVEVGAGETKDLSVQLTAGHYVLLCNEPGHYEKGMVANFTVK